ncbi:unnamed protein product [Adineta steineri]|uniref:Uncharacterized protein n=1 Tax=Adineta steineri TaxID=433720 RepID=A0A813Q7H9_9BILA|nr:unnamed protein product [Adineta steineri]
MGRKSNVKDHIISPPETNSTDTNGLYEKRLRSWKRKPTSSRRNQIPVSSAVDNEEVLPLAKSTIYTYPININNDHQQRILSNTIMSDSLTTDSAFYCSSISNSSIQTTADLNNNHVTTLNVDNRKRKNSAILYENLSNQFSQMNRSEILSNPNDENSITEQQSSTTTRHLTCMFPFQIFSFVKTNYSIFLDHQNPVKRSRLSTDDSIINSDIIDINQLDQQESLSLSINNSNSMETAVKMVQPIVDIIFHAFEDQLKNAQIKSNQTSHSNSSLTNVSPKLLHPSKIYPHFPLTSPTHPIVLHAVNFNIQLTTKQPTVVSSEQYLINTTSNENDSLQTIFLTELKRKVASCILSNSYETNGNHQRQRQKLKRIAQLAVLGVSVLCGYLLL